MRNAQQNTDFIHLLSDYKYTKLLVWYADGQHTILELILVCCFYCTALIFIKEP